MRGQWLIIGFCFWVFHFFSYPLSFLMLVLFVLYHRHRFHHHTLIFLLLCLSMIVRYQTYQKECMPTSRIFQIKEIHQNYCIAQNKEARVILYQLQGHHIDDVVEVSGKLSKIDSVRNHSQFQFVEWANTRGYYYSIAVNKYRVLHHGKSLRHHLYAYIETFEQEQQTFLKRVLFGIHDDSVAFLLVSCGMHISYVGYLLKSLAQKKMSRTNANIIRLIFILGVSYVTVLNVSLIRILCFCLVDTIFASCQRKDRLGISICILLFLVPYSAHDVSFYIPVCLRLVSIFNVAKRKPYVLNQLVLMLLQLHFFHCCDLVSLVLFPILRKGYGILYMCTWLLLLPGFHFLYSLLSIVQTCFSFFTSLHFPIYGKVYFLWFLAFFAFFTQYVSYPSSKQRLTILLLVITFVLFPYLSPFATITMLDVGQGDCTIITTPHKRHVYMIDIMGHKKKNIPEEIVVPYLYTQGIHKIDQLLITHHDFDHNGGLEQLCELMEVDDIIDQKDIAKNKQYDFMKFLLLDYKGIDENDNSIVTYLKFYRLSYLFMGDLGVKGEETLLSQYPKLAVDVLKVGHHGSNTSSSPVFIHQLQPSLALISCGRNNFYHHPSPSVLKTLKREHCYPFVTKENGSLTIYESKYFSFYITGDHKFGFLSPFKKQQD